MVMPAGRFTPLVEATSTSRRPVLVDSISIHGSRTRYLRPLSRTASRGPCASCDSADYCHIALIDRSSSGHNPLPRPPKDVLSSTPFRSVLTQLPSAQYNSWGIGGTGAYVPRIAVPAPANHVQQRPAPQAASSAAARPVPHAVTTQLRLMSCDHSLRMGCPCPSRSPHRRHPQRALR
jgi:hypothetical protein